MFIKNFRPMLTSFIYETMSGLLVSIWQIVLYSTESNCHRCLNVGDCLKLKKDFLSESGSSMAPSAVRLIVPITVCVRRNGKVVIRSRTRMGELVGWTERANKLLLE